MKNNEIRTNNTNKEKKGGIIMMNGTIENVKAFAEVVRDLVVERMGATAIAEVQEVVKNNNQRLTGITVRTKEINVSPTIYLDDFYSRYLEGESITGIVDHIIRIYEENKADRNLDISFIDDFERAKNRICFKLVNACQNTDLLSNAPHRIVFDDLAVVYFMTVDQRPIGRGTVTIKNELMKNWNTDEQTLFDHAMVNTPVLDHGEVKSIASVLSQMLGERLDRESSEEFYDLVVEADDVPMYVCSNKSKVFGAAVVLYEGLLKSFAEKIGCDFYILPSSIHETLFIPATDDMDPAILSQMVHEVNGTEVAPQDYLSDSVYYYDYSEDIVKTIR